MMTDDERRHDREIGECPACADAGELCEACQIDAEAAVARQGLFQP